MCPTPRRAIIHNVIERVDILPFEDSSGIAITFYYNTDCHDTFSVIDGTVAQEIMAIVESGCEPERVLVALRHFGNFQLH